MMGLAWRRSFSSAKPRPVQTWLRAGRERWRWLARRWTFALLGWAVGSLCVAWLHAQALGDFWDQKEQVQSLQGQLAQIKTQTHQAHQAHQALAQAAAQQTSTVWLSQLPGDDRQGVIWLQFSQLLAQHGVQLQSLRPVPDVLAAPLASQAVAVRLQATFEDWVAVWTAMNVNGPAWSIDRLRITPQAQGVDIDAVLRVWFGDGQGPDQGPDQDLHQVFEANSGPDVTPFDTVRMASTNSAVFWQSPKLAAESLAKPLPMPRSTDAQRTEVALEKTKPLTPATDGAAQVFEKPAIFSTNPAQWPLEHVRLLGVWHQSQEAHAILAAGPHWVRARVGQQVAGHKIDSIRAHEVHLLASQGAVKVLGLTKDTP